MTHTINANVTTFIAETVQHLLDALNDVKFSYLGLECMIPGYKPRTIESRQILENIASGIHYDDQVLTLVRFVAEIMQKLTPEDMNELQLEPDTIDNLDSIVGMYA